MEKDINESLICLNVNGAFGLNVAETPDYPCLNALLRDMDRLGVAQAIVWNKAAVPHAPGGNRKLLEILRASPAAQGRIIPAFIVAPAMLYERGAMDELIQTMRANHVRVVRALPKTLYYNLRCLEFLLEQISCLKPVLLVSVRECGDISGLLFLAERFPELPIIMTDAMWYDMDAVFDCMRRRPNIMVETSWIHTQGTLSLLARNFGVERIFFGLGPRAHAGAAMAGLAQSGLAPNEINAIARGNIAARLGLADGHQDVAAGCAPDSLRRRHLRGEKLGLPVIDAHAHLGASSRWIMEDNHTPDMIRQMLARMDRIGIEQTIAFLGSNPMDDDVVKGNELLESVTKPHHDRIKGMLYFHPSAANELAGRLDEFFARDFFVGFKILCGYWRRPLADPVFTPAWEYADRHCLPVLVHTWGRDSDVPHNLVGYDTPANLAPIAKKYPRAIFILGHSGGNDAGRAEAEQLALENENVFLEWSGSFCSRRQWEETIKKVGNQRIVFGTDSVYHSIDWELGRLLSLDVEDAVLTPILGANMRAILNRRR